MRALAIEFRYIGRGGEGRGWTTLKTGQVNKREQRRRVRAGSGGWLGGRPCVFFGCVCACQASAAATTLFFFSFIPLSSLSAYYNHTHNSLLESSIHNFFSFLFWFSVWWVSFSSLWHHLLRKTIVSPFFQAFPCRLFYNSCFLSTYSRVRLDWISQSSFSFFGKPILSSACQIYDDIRSEKKIIKGLPYNIWRCVRWH